jgi:hypothetical protein
MTPKDHSSSTTTAATTTAIMSSYVLLLLLLLLSSCRPEFCCCCCYYSHRVDQVVPLLLLLLLLSCRPEFCCCCCSYCRHVILSSAAAAATAIPVHVITSLAAAIMDTADSTKRHQRQGTKSRATTVELPGRENRTTSFNCSQRQQKMSTKYWWQVANKNITRTSTKSCFH